MTPSTGASGPGGWRMDLGKGLDIWQKPSDNPFDFDRQEFRLIGSAFTVHYVKIAVAYAADLNRGDGA